MTGVAGGIGEIVILLIFTWVAVFGVTGAILARNRGLVPWFGFLLGGLLGPLGWLAIHLFADSLAQSAPPVPGDDDWDAV